MEQRGIGVCAAIRLASTVETGLARGAVRYTTTPTGREIPVRVDGLHGGWALVLNCFSSADVEMGTCRCISHCIPHPTYMLARPERSGPLGRPSTEIPQSESVSVEGEVMRHCRHLVASMDLVEKAIRREDQ